jgi:hypothetical protein
MDSFNKIISFVLGLVVVIVFFAVITGRINFRKGLPSLSTPLSVTPTQTPAGNKTMTPAPTQKAGSTVTNTYGSYKTDGKTTTIPATGLPTLFIPSLLAAAATGGFLRKIGKK